MLDRRGPDVWGLFSFFWILSAEEVPLVSGRFEAFQLTVLSDVIWLAPSEIKSHFLNIYNMPCIRVLREILFNRTLWQLHFGIHGAFRPILLGQLFFRISNYPIESGHFFRLFA